MKENLEKETIAKLCHDLKNPLTIIKINLDMLNSSFEGTVQQKKKLLEITNIINKQIERMTKMLSTSPSSLE